MLIFISSAKALNFAPAAADPVARASS